MVTLAGPKQSDLLRAELPLVRCTPGSRAQDAYSVDFDHYMIVYSDHIPCRETNYAQRSLIAALMLGHNGVQEAEEVPCAGETTIGCYLGDELVGIINFYGPTEKHPRSTIDSDGLLVLWYPLMCVANILNILRHEKHLSLSLVCGDLEGKALEPPMGALLGWPRSIGRESEGDC